MSEQLPFRIRRSAVEGKRPQNADLELGELALNTYDGRLFAKKDTGGVGVGTTVTLLTPWTENIGGGLYYNEGNVGLGTTNPTTKLFVSGDINFTGNLYQNGTIFQSGGGGGTSSQWTTYPAGISTLSNVGIGTTNPTTKLQVNGSVTLGAVSSDLITFPGRIASNFYPTGDGVYDIGRPTQIGFGANRWRDANFYGKGSFDGGVDAHNLELGIGSPNLIYSTSGNLELNSQSGTTNIDDILTVSGNTGIGTVNPTSKLHVVGDVKISGVVTATTINFASGGVLGDLYSDGGIGIGLKSPANYYAIVASNNLQQFLQVDDNQIFIGTGYASTTGTYDWKFDKNGALTFPDSTIQSTAFTGYATSAGTATTATNLSDASNITTGTISSSRLTGSYGISITGTATTATNLSDAGNITTGTISSSRLTGSYGISITGTANTLADAANITTGTISSSRLSGTYGISITGTATTALGFSTTANINTSGIITATSFVGSHTGNLTGTATTATNLADAANITTGTINKDRISTTNALTVLGDLYVSNNISFGGSTTQLNTQQLQIVDADIVLGIGTTFSPTDNTANHGGIAIASTEGSPLVNLNIVPEETNPSTYKKMMWFKGSTIGAGITDAWLFNYGVGIGSTQVPNGVRLAVGQIKMTDSSITATTFTGNLTGTATTANNLSDAANITTGTISSSRLTGSYGISITGTANNLADAGNITTGTISSSRLTGSYGIDIIGTATTATNLADAANITTGTISSSRLSGIYGIDIIGTATTATTANNLSTTANINTTGIITASQLVSNIAQGTAPITVGSSTLVTNLNANYLNGQPDTYYTNATNLTGTISSSRLSGTYGISITGTATTATNLSNAANITTGTISSSRLSGTYGISITGTANTLTDAANITTGTISSSRLTGSYGISITGTATTATNLSNAANITTGTISSSRLSGTYGISITGTATTAITALGFSTTASINTSGIITAFKFSGDGSLLTGITASGTGIEIKNNGSPVGTAGTIDFTSNLSVSFGAGIATVSATGGSSSQWVSYPTGISTTSNVGIGTTNATSTLDVVGDGKFTGVVTATSFSGNASSATYATNAGVATYATTAGVATALQYSRTFEITGDIIASPISFDGTGNVSLAATIQPNSVALGSDTTGDYVQSITGTSNQIDVSPTSGEGSTPILSIPNQFTVPQDLTVLRDVQIDRNLNVNGNITLGGTTAFINVQELKIADPDIVLGFRTDAFGNDVSTDNTANHGGVALASTEGNPLVQLFIAGIETNPATYKKIMWFKAGTFAGLGTDAWLSNYAVGIGSTQFPTGTRLAAGSVQFTQNDLAVVRNINASGIVTAPTLSGTTVTYTTGNFTTGNIVTGIVTTLSGTNLNYTGVGTITTLNSTTGTVTNLSGTNLNYTGISTLGVTSATNLTAQQLNISGVSTFQNDIFFGDNDIAYFGNGNDLLIYHSGLNSYVRESGTGRLLLASDGPSVDIVKGTDTETLAKFNIDGSVELYYDNTKEFETTGYGATVFGILQSQGLQVSGASTLGITTATNLTTQNINVSGITTTNSLNIGVTQVISSARQLQNIASLDATTTATIESAIQNAPNTFTDLNVTGISTLGVTSTTNLTAQQLNVSGVSTISVNSSTDALRITQTGTGNALVVEDSTNPDASPFVIGNGGNVGIGTTNPTSKLQVDGNVLVSGVSTFIGNGTAVSPAIFAQRDSGNNAGIKLYGTSGGNFVYSESTGSNPKALIIDSSQSENILFRIAGDTKVVIQPTGEALIGSATSTGTASQRLQVTGGAYISDNLGIGITFTSSKLEVGESASTGIYPIRVTNLSTANNTTKFVGYEFYGYDTVGTGKRVSAIQAVPTNVNWIDSALTFSTRLSNTVTERVRIDGSGNLGINTTNPGATLNVVPTATSIAGLFSGTTSSDMVRITQLGTGNALVVEDSANPDSSPFVVTGIGSVGIGTASPAFTADIAGDARITSTNKMRFGGTAGTTNFYIQYNSTTNSLDFVAG